MPSNTCLWAQSAFCRFQSLIVAETSVLHPTLLWTSLFVALTQCMLVVLLPCGCGKPLPGHQRGRCTTHVVSSKLSRMVRLGVSSGAWKQAAPSARRNLMAVMVPPLGNPGGLALRAALDWQTTLHQSVALIFFESLSLKRWAYCIFIALSTALLKR